MKSSSQSNRGGDRLYYVGWSVVFIEIAIAIIIGMRYGANVGILSFFLMLSILLISIGVIVKEKVATVFGIVIFCVANPFLFALLGIDPTYGLVVSIVVVAIAILVLGGGKIGRSKKESGGGEIST